MKGLISSYRWRRRLLWLSVAAAVGVGVTVVALRWPNTAPPEPKESNIAINLNYGQIKQKRLTQHDAVTAAAVMEAFIRTAVARKHIDVSWNLVSRDFRSGFTREEWDSGNMPVTPYPVGRLRWSPQYSDTAGIGLSVAMFPRKGVHMRPQVFLIGLHKIGRDHHWVVDNWQPAPYALATGSAGDGGGSAVDSTRPQIAAAPGAKSKESPIWLLLPIGLLSLIVLIPLTVGAIGWYRGHRARVQFTGH